VTGKATELSTNIRYSYVT